MLVLALLVGATVVAILLWPTKKGGTSPPPSGGGGNSPPPPASNPFIPLINNGQMGNWIPGHDGVFMKVVPNSAGNLMYYFSTGPGVACNAGALPMVKNDSLAAKGNESCILTTEPTHHSQSTPDYTIDGVGWYMCVDADNPDIGGALGGVGGL